MNIKKLKKIGISHSRLSTYRSGCKRKFWLTMNNYINPNSTSVKNTLFGNLCHEISEKCTEDKSVIAFMDLCNVYCNKNQDQLSVLDPQTVEHEKALASITMECYFKYQKAYEGYTVLKNELYLKRLKIGDHVFNIKIDKVLKDKKTGEIAILDHKCKSRFNVDILAKKIIIDKQFQLYRKGFETAYKRKVDKIIWDIIRKSGLRMTKKENMNGFMDRVKMDIEKRPEYYFISIPLMLRPEYCKNFDNELEQEMNEIYRNLEQGESAFTKNTEVCDSPFLCDFLDGCSSGNMDLYIKRKD